MFHSLGPGDGCELTDRRWLFTSYVPRVFRSTIAATTFGGRYVRRGFHFGDHRVFVRRDFERVTQDRERLLVPIRSPESLPKLPPFPWTCRLFRLNRAPFVLQDFFNPTPITIDPGITSPPALHTTLTFEKGLWREKVRLPFVPVRDVGIVGDANRAFVFLSTFGTFETGSPVIGAHYSSSAPDIKNAARDKVASNRD
jgi:hypothetical protein